ncbi:hypothetical protein Taro_050590 [Colocasia esculenta]|uniref:Cytochrome b-c1 complex subunit Rieske transmembrane domain-containing protein n=1 Tax=Colocasia esculenta TaxID=4460 RepID=A0A843XDU1_COLES|nr:hypothetical protein [Colocasia esculenta]
MHCFLVLRLQYIKEEHGFLVMVEDLMSVQQVLVRHHMGFATIVPKHDELGLPELPATELVLKNPTPKIVYDEHNHERFPPGDPSKRAFAYFVLTGGRFVYASLLRLLILKFVLSMSATKDVLALASLEVDLSGIEPGSTVTVKWRGKPVFIRCRTEEDIKLANSVDLPSLRDPEEDAARVKNPEWLVVVGVCTHLGCIPLPNAGDFGGWQTWPSRKAPRLFKNNFKVPRPVPAFGYQWDPRAASGYLIACIWQQAMPRAPGTEQQVWLTEQATCSVPSAQENPSGPSSPRGSYNGYTTRAPRSSGALTAERLNA